MDSGRMSIDLLVYFDADGALSDVPDPTGTTVVELMRHAFVNGTIHLDVNIISDLVGTKVGGQGDVPLLPERTGKEVPSAGTKPMTSRHPLRPSLLLPLRCTASCGLEDEEWNRKKKLGLSM